MPDGFDSLFWVGQNYRVRHVLRLVRHVGYRAGGIGLAKRSHERPHEPEMNSETRDQGWLLFSCEPPGTGGGSASWRSTQVSGSAPGCSS